MTCIPYTKEENNVIIIVTIVGACLSFFGSLCNLVLIYINFKSLREIKTINNDIENNSSLFSSFVFSLSAVDFFMSIFIIIQQLLFYTESP